MCIPAKLGIGTGCIAGAPRPHATTAPSAMVLVRQDLPLLHAMELSAGLFAQFPLMKIISVSFSSTGEANHWRRFARWAYRFSSFGSIILRSVFAYRIQPAFFPAYA